MTLADALADHLRSGPLDVPVDLVPMLRTCVIGGDLLPWRLSTSTDADAELTWTIDLGHDSGVRRWFVARARRVADGWQIRSIGLAHARRVRADR